MDERYFKKLFDLGIEHNYYTAAVSADFGIFPTDECSKTLRSLGLFFKQQAFGFALFYEAYKNSASVITPFRILDNEFRLTFTIKLNNPYLVNFSELPVKRDPASIYYFDNLTLNKNASNELLLVDDTINKYAGSADLINLKASIYDYESVTAAVSQNMKIRDKNDALIKEDTASNSGGKIRYQFKLTDYPAGIYKFLVDDVLKDTFYKDPVLMYEGIWGIIDIFKNASVPADYIFADPAGNISAKSYKISFQRRATYWKYIVINKYKPVTPNLSLQVGADPPITGAAYVLPDGTLATMFQLTGPSELKEEPVKNIKLSSNGDILISNLPNPGYEIIKPDIAVNKVYSEIFVYI